MALRLIEAYIPETGEEKLESLLDELDVQRVWKEDVSDGSSLVRILVDVGGSDALVGALTERFEHLDGFQALILEVEAAVPRISDGEEAEKEAGGDRADAPKGGTDVPENAEGGERPNDDAAFRVSIEELQERIEGMSRLTPVFVAMAILSAIVAAIGLIQDSPAIVIGSMVIAPLLGPSVGLSLATTLADGALGRHALKANGVGALLSLGIAFSIGILLPVDPTVNEILSRTRVSFWDVTLGLAVGGAGVLSVTTGVSTALVGVMVAVALLPPLVVVGLLAGSGYAGGALAAATLLATYVVTFNLAGVVTFLAQGVRPRRRWEAERARRSTGFAIGIWLLLVALLALIIHFAGLGLSDP